MDLVTPRPEPDSPSSTIDGGASPSATARAATGSRRSCSCPAMRRTWRASRPARSTIIAPPPGSAACGSIIRAPACRRAISPTARSTAGSTRCSRAIDRRARRAGRARRIVDGRMDRAPRRAAPPDRVAALLGHRRRARLHRLGLCRRRRQGRRCCATASSSGCNPDGSMSAAHARLLAIGPGAAAARRADRTADPGPAGPRHDDGAVPARRAAPVRAA